MNESRFRGILAGVATCAALMSVPAFGATSLAVVNAAQIGGSAFGLRVTYSSGTENAFVQDDTPADELNFYGSFSVRNTNMTLTTGSQHQIYRARSQPGNVQVFRVEIKNPIINPNNDKIIFVFARRDDNSFAGPLQIFSNTQNRVTLEWHRSTGVDTNDGSLKLFVGTTLRGSLLNIDNDTMAVDDIQLGAFGGVDTTTTGTQDFDEYVSTRAAQF